MAQLLCCDLALSLTEETFHSSVRRARPVWLGWTRGHSQHVCTKKTTHNRSPLVTLVFVSILSFFIVITCTVAIASQALYFRLNSPQTSGQPFQAPPSNCSTNRSHASTSHFRDTPSHLSVPRRDNWFRLQICRFPHRSPPTSGISRSRRI